VKIGLRIPLLFIALIVAGCRAPGTSESTRLSLEMRRVPATRGSLDSLSIAVPLSRTPWAGGRCDEMPPVPTAPDANFLSMLWGERGAQDRRVTVAFDGLGNPVGYTDVRGGLSTVKTNPDPDAPTPAGTLIVINLQRERASVENQYEDGKREGVLVDMSKALQSELLGDPSRIIEEVFARCAGGKGGGAS
jgi:hypothetical protein